MMKEETEDGFVCFITLLTWCRLHDCKQDGCMCVMFVFQALAEFRGKKHIILLKWETF